MVGDEDLNLVGDAAALSALGGDASDVALIITSTDEARGAIFIDYSEAGNLPDLEFVDGEIVPVTGTRVEGEPISADVDAQRNASPDLPTVVPETTGVDPVERSVDTRELSRTKCRPYTNRQGAGT